MRALGTLLAAVAAALLLALPAAGAAPRVLVVEFDNDVNPVTQDYLQEEMHRAERGGFAAVVIEMDTPGGLGSSMREIVKTMLSLKVPVVVYVAPPGSSADSAGAVIGQAADILAMAPQTNIGSSTPISATGGNLGSDLRKKVINDAAAYVAELAREHGRNADAAEAMVRDAANFGAREALEKGVIDVMAPTVPALLEKIDGTKTVPKGLVLHTAGAQVERVEMGFWKRALDVLIDPNIIALMLSLGLVGILVELWNPGLILPGTVGVISLLVGLYGLQVLPVSAAGVAPDAVRRGAVRRRGLHRQPRRPCARGRGHVRDRRADALRPRRACLPGVALDRARDRRNAGPPARRRADPRGQGAPEPGRGRCVDHGGRRGRRPARRLGRARRGALARALRRRRAARAGRARHRRVGPGGPGARRRITEPDRKGLMDIALIVVAIVVVILLVILFAAVKIAREYERGVIFRLGRLLPEPKGPGLFVLIPFVDKMERVDLRTVTLNVPPQEVITKDNVPVRVNAVAYFRIVEPKAAIVQVENYMVATSQIAQTTLRSVLGQHVLDELLSERDKINQILQGIIDEATSPWGIKVSVVEVKDVEIPADMQRAMARQAEAERERRAKVISAEGEYQASERLKDAAAVMAQQPITVQLRYLQTLLEIGATNNSTIVFPIPIEFLETLGLHRPKES